MAEVITSNKEELEKKAVDIIKKSINKILKEKQYVVLAVPGGRSVSGIFNLLKNADIPWDKVHIFMVDERLVPLDDNESNFKLVKEHLPDKNLHPFNIVDGIEEYQLELRKHGNAYDVVLLSAGEDGHVGALYPAHHSIEDESEFFIEMDDSPKPPKDRMTMSRKLLLKARVGIVLFFGETKREAYEMFNDDAVDFKSCPAKLVKSLEESYVLTDLK